MPYDLRLMTKSSSNYLSSLFSSLDSLSFSMFLMPEKIDFVTLSSTDGDEEPTFDEPTFEKAAFEEPFLDTGEVAIFMTDGTMMSSKSFLLSNDSNL